MLKSLAELLRGYNLQERQEKIDLRTIDAFGVGGTNAAFVSEHSQRKLRKTKDRMDKDKRLVCESYLNFCSDRRVGCGLLLS
jgi:hypothetical protein